MPNAKIRLSNADRDSTLESQSDRIGTVYLTDNPEYYEVQRGNTFEFYVSGLSGSLNIPQNTYAQANADDVIKLSVTNCPIPHFTQETVTVRRGNSVMKFAGLPTFGEGSITVNDFIGAGTKDILMAWQAKSYNVETEKVGLAKDYKYPAYLLEYTPDFQLVRTWKLYGCWISGISEDNYSSDQGDKHTVTATIQYDKAQIDTSSII